MAEEQFIAEELTIAEENRKRFEEEEERKAAMSGGGDLWARLQNTGANDPAAVKQRQKQHHTPIEDKERKKRAKAKAKKRSFRTEDDTSMILPNGRGELRVAGTDICINSGAIKGFAKSSVKRKDYEDEDDYYYDEDDYYDEEEDYDKSDDEYYYHDDRDAKDERGVVEEAEDFAAAVKEISGAMGDEEKATTLSQGEFLNEQLKEMIESGVFEKDEDLARALNALEGVQNALKLL